MSTAPQSRRRELALTIITGVVGLAATAFAVIAASYLFLI